MLLPYFMAGYPSIAVEVADEWRFKNEILKLIEEVEKIDEKKGFLEITSLGQLRSIPNGNVVNENMSFDEAFHWATRKSCVLVVYDWYRIADNFGALGYRSLLNSLQEVKKQQSFIILVAPSWRLPEELKVYVPVLKHGLPKRDELRSALTVIEQNSGRKAKDADAVLDAASGLSLSFAEDTMALAVVQSGEISPAYIEAEKIKLIRQQTGLEITTKVSLEDVGGLEKLKKWIVNEVVPFRRDPQLAVRATLFVGPPGTGKSHMAKAMGSLLNIPVIRLDLAACRGQYVGQTESTVKSALNTVDAVAPCVLWVDEVDSALGGHVSSAATDGGVTLSVLSIFLTWMQEHDSDVILVATANYPERIPPAFLRPGRLDAIWAVDLPNFEERKAIAGIHFRKLGCNVSEQLCTCVAKNSEEFSGAEVANAVLSAARKTNRKITEEAVVRSCSEIIPLAVSRSEEIRKMREWAKTYARSAHETASTTRRVRHIVEN